jgi:glycosyltransferase involved in cell wall biosynthesis
MKAKKTICLNMIVKNESPVIERCLASVKGMIDYWVIVDTGSTDGTQKIIKEFLKDIPGELHERPWVDFGHNRNEALTFAKKKGDYILLMDADEHVVYSKDFELPALDKDSYITTLKNGPCTNKRILLLDNHLDWKWEGVLHELPICPKAKNFTTINGITIHASTTESHRARDSETYQKDAQILEAALAKDPANSRYVFYLAQSYSCAKNYLLALQNYEKRAAMGGDEQEVFWSLYKIGEIQEFLEFPFPTVVDSFCKAYHFRPSRAEPLHRLAELFSRRKNYILGYSVANIGLFIPLSHDATFVIEFVYDYGLLSVYSECAFHLGKYQESERALLQIAAKAHLPQDIRERVEHNLKTVRLYTA